MRGPKSIRSGPPTKIITEKKEITKKKELANHRNEFFIAPKASAEGASI